MTREKQIDDFANSQVDCEFFNEDLYEGIIIGAKWADETLLKKIEAYFKANYNMPENFMAHLKKNIFSY